tara:strand:+ start:43 stop:606 length:564 start_codon:yes stop_codon:yes gene_type:complete
MHKFIGKFLLDYKSIIDKFLIEEAELMTSNYVGIIDQERIPNEVKNYLAQGGDLNHPLYYMQKIHEHLEIKKLSNFLDLQQMSCTLQMQKLDHTVFMHNDSNLYKGPYLRFFITPEDQVPGQIVLFDKDYWQFEQGSAVVFDVDNVHGTANLAPNTQRFLIVLTGIPTERTWSYINNVDSFHVEDLR